MTDNHGYAFGWVGQGDAADWYKFNIDDENSSIRYGFLLYQQTARSANMKLYRIEDGALKNEIELDSKIDNSAILGTGDYALEIRSADNGNGKKNTVYDLEMMAFDINNEDDNWGDGAQNLVFHEWGATYVEDWVGFGDAKDWFNIKITDADRYQFDLYADKYKYANMNLYDVDELGNLGKRIKFDSDSATYLADGNYALEISSADNGKGKKNTGYGLFISPYGGGIS
ncbi:MAG: hypothetical protein PHI56_04045 [Victivallaceae bacterium]|nr:hypothetical protein [Victivallaceae bacterium]